MKVFFDFETRSGCDLRACGTHVYSKDPTTDAMCLAWAIDDGPVKIWKPFEGDSEPTEILECVEAGAEMIAHNAAFERLIWRNVCVTKYGWPPILDENLYCSMVMSYSMGMMGALENAAKCVGLTVEKDMKGNRVMLQLAKPRTVDKKTGEITWWERADSTPKLDIGAKYEMVYAYCMQDINVQRELYKRLLPLDPIERQLWLLDQKINDRGIWIDARAAANAIELADIEAKNLNLRMQELTDRDVSSCNAHAALKKWVNAQGVETDSVDKASVMDILEDELTPPHVRKVLEIRQSAAKSSINKLNRMLSGLEGGRVKGNFQYYGAASTGRWCMPEGHEVLTPSGWVDISGWGHKSQIMCFNSQSRKLSFMKARKVEFDYTGQLFSADNNYISFSVTPEHSVPYLSKGGNITVARAIILADMTKKPVVLGGTFHPLYERLDLKGRMLIATQADGNFATDTRSGKCLRFGFRKERKVLMMRDLLTDLKIKFKEHHQKDSIVFYIAWVDTPQWLKDFSDKQFGSFLLEYNPEVLISEIEHWDGHRHKKNPGTVEYSTCSRNNAEWVSTIAHLAGRRGRIITRNRQVENWNVSHRVWISENPSCVLSPSEWEKSYFEGKVYCAETPTGFFIIRRNGKISVTGNSGRGVQLQNLQRPSMKQPAIEEVLDMLGECV